MSGKPKNSFLDRFRKWNRERIAHRRRMRPATETVFGFKMNALQEMRNGQFEPFETALVRTLLKRSDRFLNVGANMGYYCCFAQAEGVRTVALEPVASNVHFIIQNMRANGWGKNITVLPVAAGAEPGFADIFGIGTGASLVESWGRNPGSQKQTVPVVRIDDCVAPPVAGERMLVLMDVEGFEYFALQGALGLIMAEPKPVWMVEILPGDEGGEVAALAAQAFGLFQNAGYRAFALGEVLTEVTEPSEGANNFLFLDGEMSLEDVLGSPSKRVPTFV